MRLLSSFLETPGSFYKFPGFVKFLMLQCLNPTEGTVTTLPPAIRFKRMVGRCRAALWPFLQGISKEYFAFSIAGAPRAFSHLSLLKLSPPPSPHSQPPKPNLWWLHVLLIRADSTHRTWALQAHDPLPSSSDLPALKPCVFIQLLTQQNSSLSLGSGSQPFWDAPHLVSPFSPALLV